MVDRCRIPDAATVLQICHVPDYVYRLRCSVTISTKDIIAQQSDKGVLFLSRLPMALFSGWGWGFAHCADADCETACYATLPTRLVSTSVFILAVGVV